MEASVSLQSRPSHEIKAIRGAIQIAADRSDLVADGTVVMLEALLANNGLERTDLVSCVFTVTPDLTSEIPALALRDAGWGDVPILCASEVHFKGAPPRTIRVLAHVRCHDTSRELRSAYLQGANAGRLESHAPSDGEDPFGQSEPNTDNPTDNFQQPASEHAGLHRTLQEIEALIGSDNIQRLCPSLLLPDIARRNVSMFRSRRLRAIVRPGSVDAVQAIVRIVGNHASGVGLHPISTGRNWGLGSSEPATDNTITVDLVKLNATRQIDCDAGWAIVEPGVTQLMLARLLSGTSRMLNVTASSGHTSVVGNALERGVGLRRQRTEDLAGLEVVLPNGEMVRVGWWPDHERKTAINPHGHGPSLLHLFTQSNLGVVTAAVVRLLPRPESQCVVRLTFQRTMLETAVDAMRRWVAQGLVCGVLKVYDAESSASYGGAPNEQLALLCVSGTHRQVKAISALLFDEASENEWVTQVSLSTDSPAPEDDSVLQVVEHAYAGDPSMNESMLRRATGADAQQVDSHGGGWLFFLAFVPFQGRCIRQAMSLVDRIQEATGQRIGTTINSLSADVIDLVVSFKFSPEDAPQAHRALDMAYEFFADAGFFPYRLDIDHAHWRQKLSDPSAYQLNSRIKQLLDPTSLMASGRYA